VDLADEKEAIKPAFRLKGRKEEGAWWALEARKYGEETGDTGHGFNGLMNEMEDSSKGISR